MGERVCERDGDTEGEKDRCYSEIPFYTPILDLSSLRRSKVKGARLMYLWISSDHLEKQC